MKKSLLIFLLFGACLLATAKDYDISNLTNNDGLSNSSVNTIFQDSDGLLWLGTWDGLNVYNGREFKVCKPDPGNAQTISNNIIRDLVEEQQDVLWIATDRGINRLDKKTHLFERFFVDAADQRVSNEHSFLITKNSSNQLFVSIYDRGVYYYDAELRRFVNVNIEGDFRIKKVFFDLDDNLWLHTEEKELVKVVFRKGDAKTPSINHLVTFSHLNNIASVFVHSNNELWMQTSDERFYSYQISEGILSEHRVEAPSTGLIRAIIFKEDYQLWGTANGLYLYTPKTNQRESLLPHISVLSLHAGTQQIIWVGSDMQGVWQLSPSTEKIRSYTAATIPAFAGNAVRTFFEEKDHTLWVGTKGGGIFTFSNKDHFPATDFDTNFTTDDGLLSNSVFTIVEGSPSDYWIGTDGRGVNYYNTTTNAIKSLFIHDTLQQKINLSSVYSILQTGEKTLWVGTSGYGMYQLIIDRSTNPYSIQSYKQFIYQKNGAPSLSNNIVYSIIRDDSSHMWIATRGGGLNRFNHKTEQFQHFRFSSEDPDFISSDDILCLYKDTKGFLWAGTSMGLNKLLHFKNGKPVFQRFTEKEGMPNNTIHGILEDRDHSIWVSTNKGLANLVFEQGAYRIIPYFKKDGLQNNEFSDGAFYESPYSHQFYFGGIRGFNAFNPLEITHSNYMPTLWMDAFYLENRPTNLSDFLQPKKAGQTLVLANKHTSFSFNFIPIDYIAGTKCEISYLLEGFQKDWIHLGTSNTLVFTNLPSGRYVLKVRCSNANKIWSEGYFSLPVRILPPWWASPFAFFCYFLLLVCVLLGIRRFIKYQLAVRNEATLKELEKIKTEEIHQAKLSFFTNIAHEFSNSITLIYGPCEQLLRTHPADSYTRKYINIIKSNSARMQHMIQQMIEFRKAETGHLKLDIERIDVPELVKFAVDNFMEILEEKKIHLSLSFSPEVIFWQTDRDSVEKVVFNLLSNAVKYTPDEENLDVRTEIKGSLLLIRVTNTGVGIKPAFQQRIFDRFEVLNQFEIQVSKGFEIRNGIGLALCKSIVEVLHGNIEVESDGKTFTSFLVSLPEQALDESAVQEGAESLMLKKPVVGINEDESVVVPPSSVSDAKKGGVVLVIDDDKEIRQLLKELLSEKFDVTVAANGQEAIEIMRLQMPTIIVCDIIMPVMDGVKFVQLMKAHGLTRHIPIILLSSRNTIESQIEGFEIGADAYLNKPFHPRHLEAMIESLLHRNRAVLEYSESIYAALEQYEGKLIHKEDKTLMLHVTKIIHDQIDNEALSLDFIASEVVLSKMQLYRKIKEITGQAPTEYIRSIRLKQAEKLLKTTNMTVLEVMFHCGFNNKAYFYREFAKKYHLTPKEYRNQKD